MVTERHSGGGEPCAEDQIGRRKMPVGYFCLGHQRKLLLGNDLEAVAWQEGMQWWRGRAPQAEGTANKHALRGDRACLKRFKKPTWWSAEGECKVVWDSWGGGQGPDRRALCSGSGWFYSKHNEKPPQYYRNVLRFNRVTPFENRLYT